MTSRFALPTIYFNANVKEMAPQILIKYIYNQIYQVYYIYDIYFFLFSFFKIEESDTAIRRCQLGGNIQETKIKGINQLLSWEHFAPPFESGILRVRLFCVSN